MLLSIIEDEELIITCCIKENSVSQKELEDFDRLLCFYGQKYRMKLSNFEEGADIYCKTIKDVRNCIIDKNSKRDKWNILKSKKAS